MLKAEKGKAYAVMCAKKLVCASWAKIRRSGSGLDIKIDGEGWEGLRATHGTRSSFMYDI
jgi:hypothetical protein